MTRYSTGWNFRRWWQEKLLPIILVHFRSSSWTMHLNIFSPLDTHYPVKVCKRRTTSSTWVALKRHNRSIGSCLTVNVGPRSYPGKNRTRSRTVAKHGYRVRRTPLHPSTLQRLAIDRVSMVREEGNFGRKYTAKTASKDVARALKLS